VRLCFPKLFCWLADHMENAKLHGIAINCYHSCKIPTEKLGKHSETGYPTRSHQDYIATYKESDETSLHASGVKNIQNALWSIPSLNPPELVRAHILHNILLGVFEHLIDWIQGFLEHHDRINAFHYVWRQLPPYSGFTAQTKAYREVSQSSGKDMRNLS